MRSKNVARNESNDIDLTPMLDVVFIMLIFFVVTASFLQEKSIPLFHSPNSSSKIIDPPQPIVIDVSSSDEISINNRAIDLNAVGALLAQKHAESKASTLVINAHEEASANSYIAIADAARQAKISHFSLKLYE